MVVAKNPLPSLHKLLRILYCEFSISYSFIDLADF